MNGPTPAQERLLWQAATALGMFLLVGFAALLLILVICALRLLQGVLIPIGIAAVLAYLLHPVISFFERRGLRRTTAILTVFGGVALLGLGILVFLAPKIYSQALRLLQDGPALLDRLQAWAAASLVEYPDIGSQLEHLKTEIPQRWSEISGYGLHLVGAGLQQALDAFGFVLGLFFIPLYVFYFLRDTAAIQQRWQDYVPLKESKFRSEFIFILNEINSYLIVFFRGQVLVALINGVIMAAGLTLIGLQYGLLIGLVAGLLSIVPYLGLISSLIPACLIAYFQTDGGWSLLALTLAVFAGAQMIEGLFVSPRIMGERTGLHPVTVIIGILVWSVVLGGLLGPILAIPLTATLRVLMFRYFWKPAATPEAPA